MSCGRLFALPFSCENDFQRTLSGSYAFSSTYSPLPHVPIHILFCYPRILHGRTLEAYVGRRRICFWLSRNGIILGSMCRSTDARENLPVNFLRVFQEKCHWCFACCIVYRSLYCNRNKKALDLYR